MSKPPCFNLNRRAMKTDDLIAIDIHTHAEVSCWNPFDNYGEEYDRAADKYFGSNRRPTIDETVAYYREIKDRPGDVHGRQRERSSAAAASPTRRSARRRRRTAT
jgi:hypothetical protein